MTIKVLFVVNGLGLGNSTRCLAVMEELSKAGITLEVVTSGNGSWFLSNRSEIAKLHTSESFHYGSKGGQISILQTFLGIRGMIGTLGRNMHLLEKIIERFQPDVVVADSDYTYRPVKKANIPLVALNNANVVYHAFFSYKNRPRSIWAQFFGVEMLDFLFHKVVPNAVISPTLDQSLNVSSAKFFQVGPIVRETYKQDHPFEQNTGHVVIMLSGSVFGTQVRLKHSNYPFKIDIVGRNAPEDWQPNDTITYHGKILHALPILSKADLVVVNGGFSAVSEMFCMKKPMVVIPVPNHAEQWANGRAIENLGVGIVADENSLEESMLLAYDRLDDFRKSYRSLPTTLNGAAQMAEKIISIANVSSKK
jgi:uncharacterized protein (TIGR00661 family)